MKQKLTEADLAKHLITALTYDGWECYSEVQIEAFGHRADVVAVKNGKTWVFECKLSANMDVLGQALRWVGQSHMVSICTPLVNISTSRENFIHDWLMRAGGIGWHVLNIAMIEEKLAQFPDRNPQRYEEELRRTYRSHGVDPKLNRSAHKNAVKLRGALCPHMNNFVAGSGGSAYSTPYKRVMNDAEIMIRNYPGIEIGVLVDRITHHYASRVSAMNSIRSHIERTKAAYRVDGAGKHAKVYPIEASL